jgi:hypothetical protein
MPPPRIYSGLYSPDGPPRQRRRRGKNGTARALLLGLSGAGLILLAGCENAFSPKGPYMQQLVVYSILTTRSDTQYVKVYTTYNPSGFNPLEQATDTYVRGARVTIGKGDGSFLFRDTTIARIDQSRYSTDVAAYVAYPMPISRDSTYLLQVVSDQGAANASVTVPGRGAVTANNPFVLNDPGRYAEDVSATVYLSPATAGYLLRILVTFEYLEGGVWKQSRAEVPFSGTTQPNGDITLNYPILTRRTASLISPTETVYFAVGAYEALLAQLQSRYGIIHLVSAAYILTQVEQNLYRYFNIVNGFQDQFSIRTDQPDYTDVQGGLGLFGAMTEDSVVVDPTKYQ